MPFVSTKGKKKSILKRIIAKEVLRLAFKSSNPEDIKLDAKDSHGQFGKVADFNDERKQLIKDFLSSNIKLSSEIINKLSDNCLSEEDVNYFLNWITNVEENNSLYESLISIVECGFKYDSIINGWAARWKIIDGFDLNINLSNFF